MSLSQPPALSTVRPLPGWIVATYVNYRGKKLGPYYSRTWKERGKIKREYVKPYDLARVRAACQAHRDKRHAQLECTRNFTRLAGNLNYLDRIAKRADKNSLRPQDFEFLDRIANDGIEIPGRPSLRSSPVQGKYRAAGMGAHTEDLIQDVRTQYPRPNTQYRKRNFMYPPHTKIKKQLLNNLIATLDRPLREKRNAESTEEKFTRWLNDFKYTPPAEPNAIHILPDSVQRNEIDDFVAECLSFRPPLRNQENMLLVIEGME